jgi:hypothetical protein
MTTLSVANNKWAYDITELKNKKAAELQINTIFTVIVAVLVEHP